MSDSKDTLQKSPKGPLQEGDLSAESSPEKEFNSVKSASTTHCIICALPDPSESSVNQKIVTYFLKKLLKYQLLSNSQISTLTLKENDIHFCSECDEQLTASFSLHLEIAELESKLAQIRSSIEDKILATLNSDGVDFWGQQVRRRVREESSTISPVFEILGLEEEVDDEELTDYALDPIDINDHYDDDNHDELEQEEDDIEIIEAPLTLKVTPVSPQRKLSQQFQPRRSSRPNRAATKKSFVSEDSRAGRIKAQGMTPCSLCPMKCATESDLATHMARNHTTKFTCLVCKITFRRGDYFKVHISCHSDYPSTGNTIPITDVEVPIELSSGSSGSSEDSDSDFALSKHKSTNRDPKKENISSSQPKLCKTCPLCPLSFDYYYRMIRHLNKEHETAPKFSCEVESCGWKFLKKEYLASHNRLEHGDRTTLPDAATDLTQTKLTERTCSVCWKIFERPSDMKKHHTSVHLTLDKNFICEICAKQFKRPENLKQHLIFHSTGLKIFNCDHDQCGKSFRRKRDLLVHQRLHTGVRGFLCSLCGQSFRHESSFRRHHILLHGLQPSKKYECKTCGKVFKIKWHLDQHLQSRSHGGPGLKKRVRQRKNSGDDSRTRRKFARVKPSQGRDDEQKLPIDLVGSAAPISVVRQSHPRFVSNSGIPPHSTQQPQNFDDGHFNTNWAIQPGFIPTQHQQFF